MRKLHLKVCLIITEEELSKSRFPIISELSEPEETSPIYAKTKIDPYTHKNYYVTYNFQLINLKENNKFNFRADSFEREDALILLETLYALSHCTYSELHGMGRDEEIEVFGEPIHFSIQELKRRKKLISILKEHLKSIDLENQIPKIMDNEIHIIQFALYTDDKCACEKCGRKSPRVYCIWGTRGVLYPIFYDAYHETHPTKQKCETCFPNNK